MNLVHAVPLLAVVMLSTAEELQLLLLHNNDMHARFDQTSESSGFCKTPRGCFGGFARVAHVIREARALADAGTGPKVLYLNAGDTYTGTPWFTVHKHRISADFLNALRPDAISLGNHEFDFGVEGLMPFLELFKSPVVCANIDTSKDKNFNRTIEKSVVLTVDGHKIGVIGYLTNQTEVIATTGDVIFLDEVESITKESERLDAEGVKIIIAVGHSGFEIDKQIAAKVPLVDVVIGGHTNTFLYNGKPPSVETPEGLYPTVVVQASGKKVPVVQAYAYTKYMGRLLTVFDEDGELKHFTGNPELLNSSIPQDKDVLELLEKYRPGIERIMNESVGYARSQLDASQCRFKECNFGNLITDALIAQKVEQHGGAYWTDTAIAVVNGGSIRMTIDPGKITRGQILGTLPFDLDIISFDLTGEDILTMLETASRSNGDTSRGEFLQMSGLKVVYDLEKPRGSRVVSVETRCARCKVPTYSPLQKNSTYRLLSSKYILTGGDGYTVLKQKATKQRVEDLNDADTISWYLTRQRYVYPEESGRIVLLKTKDSKGSANNVVQSSSIFLIPVIVSLLRSI